jgi:hypothetical protein
VALRLELVAWCSSRSPAVSVSWLGEGCEWAVPMCRWASWWLTEWRAGRSHRDSSYNHRP